MIKITLEYAKKRFGSVIQAARSQPVIVCKRSRAHVVFISADEYTELMFFKNIKYVVHNSAVPDDEEGTEQQRVDLMLLKSVLSLSARSGKPVAVLIRMALASVIDDHSIHRDRTFREGEELCWNVKDLISLKDVK